MEGGEVKEFGRLDGLFLFVRGNTNRLPVLACCLDGSGSVLLRNPFTHRLHARKSKSHMVIFFFLKEHDLSVTLCQHSKGWCLDTPHIQGLVVQDREKTGGINADQPVRFLAAECRLIKGLIPAARFQMCKSLTDGTVLHRGNPKTGDGLSTSGHIHRQTEDQFPLASCVTAVDNLGHVRSLH